MAACVAPSAFDIQSLLECNKSLDYLAQVLEFVSEYKHLTHPLKNPAGTKLMIGDLDDTMYKEKPREVNGWGKFYLPDIVNMQVIGVVDGTSCPCAELVLMTCEDRKVYGYDGEELHVVAASLEELCSEGIEYPAFKSYYNGEAFKDMTKKDWDEVRKGAVGRRLDEEHRKLVTTGKSKFLEDLKSMDGPPADGICPEKGKKKRKFSQEEPSKHYTLRVHSPVKKAVCGIVG